MARRIRVRWSMPRTPTSDRKIRVQVGKLRNARESGRAFEDVLRETGDKHLIRKGGRVTLNAEA